MAERSESSIEVAATPAQVMAVIADFDAYPEWAGVKRATVVKAGDGDRAEEVNLVIDAGVVKDDYVLRYDWHGDESVSWTLVRGTLMKAQEGTYTLTPVEGGTHVGYQLMVDVTIPVLGVLKRKAERMIMDTALKGLKKRVEVLNPA